MRAMKFKKSFKQTVADNEQAIRNLCVAAGKPIPEQFAAKPVAVPKPRKPSVASDPHELEASVMTDVSDLIAVHPAILWAVRQNNGSAVTESGRPILFYRWARRRGVEMVITDFWGMLMDGRMFAIEAKARRWKGVGTGDTEKAIRERKQQAFINVVKSAGGVGGFVTCAEDALALLS